MVRLERGRRRAQPAQHDRIVGVERLQDSQQAGSAAGAVQPGELAGHLARPLGRLQLAQRPRLPAEHGDDRADQHDQRQQQREIDEAALPEGVAREA